MTLSAISEDHLVSARRAVEYWVKHWDWECPLLFGAQIGDLERILYEWSDVLSESETARLVHCSFVELLYGGSTPPKASLPKLIGIPYDEAEQLLAVLEACDSSSQS